MSTMNGAKYNYQSFFVMDLMKTHLVLNKNIPGNGTQKGHGNEIKRPDTLSCKTIWKCTLHFSIISTFPCFFDFNCMLTTWRQTKSFQNCVKSLTLIR